MQQNAYSFSTILNSILEPKSLGTGIYALLAAIAAALFGALLTYWLHQIQLKREYRSLLLSFCTEYVLAFERCVLYYKQAIAGEVSYSALFAFADASMFSKLAAVCTKPEVAVAIYDLKAAYFQIQRHVEEASKFAVESDLEVTQSGTQMTKAKKMQWKAIAFFKGENPKTYEDIVKNIDIILQEAKDECTGKNSPALVDELFRRFTEAKEKKYILDDAYKLKAIINEIPKLKQFYMYGSYAADTMEAHSDIDLLAIGDHDISLLQKKLNQLQKDIGREINVINNMDENEFKKRMRQKDSFIFGILNKEHIKISPFTAEQIEQNLKPKITAEHAKVFLYVLCANFAFSAVKAFLIHKGGGLNP